MAGGFPRPWMPTGLLVEEEDHRPNLLLRQKILPGGHRRIPGAAFARQSGPALGDPPEHEALGQLRDGAVVLEVRGQRIEARGVWALSVEMVAVARHAVLVVDPVPLGDVCR